MSREMKVSLLSDKSIKLLSRLNECFEKHKVLEPSNSCVQNTENAVFKTQITWIFNRSDLHKTNIGKCLKSSKVQVKFPNISYLWLEIYPKKENSDLLYVDLFLCFNNVPENMRVLCDVFILNNNRDIIWEERFCEKAADIKEKKIGFLNNFVGFEKQCKLNTNVFIQCRIKLVSSIYKCVSGSRTYAINETPKLDSSMEDILKNGKYSDVVLKVNNNKIKSHKCILALKSPALHILLKVNYENELELKSEEYSTFIDVLNFMYTEYINVNDFHHAWKLYISADKYEVQNLKELCSTYLSANLTEKNISFVFDIAREKDDEYLLQACIAFIKEHDVEIAKKAFFLKYVQDTKK